MAAKKCSFYSLCNQNAVNEVKKEDIQVKIQLKLYLYFFDPVFLKLIDI